MVNLNTIAVLITNVTGGGTVRHAQELTHAWSMQMCRILYIYITGSIISINCFENGKKIRSHLFVGHEDGERLLRLLKAYHVQVFHVEHLLDAPLYLLEIHKKLDIPLVVVMHDYYMICPFIRLTDKNECYCGEEGISACQKCLQERKFISRTFGNRIVDIRVWRQRWKSYLESADLVIVPSMDMKKRVKRYYSHLHLRMIENPEIINWHRTQKRIALIGNLSTAKGGQKLKECLSYCAEHRMDFHFYLFGILSEATLDAAENEYITILGSYDEKGIYEQILEEQIDFFWFPGICPETYSYTLTIPIRLKIPCISTDLGAIASRITDNHWGKIYPWQYDAEQIVHELEQFPYEEYKNSNFTIQNTSFGNIETYYSGIKVLHNEIEFHQEQFPASDCIRHLTGKYEREAFRVLWKLANVNEKIHLLFHIDLKWVKTVLSEKGIIYFYKVIQEKYFK